MTDDPFWLPWQALGVPQTHPGDAPLQDQSSTQHEQAPLNKHPVKPAFN
jgi:hypothetical protein